LRDRVILYSELDKLKFAIIGCGRIAARHAGIINSLSVLSAVCDIKEDRATALAGKYSCRHYKNIDELLAEEKGIDVVSVCTPNWLHAEHSIKSLGAGRHVLCEKPMAITTADCSRMIQAAEKNKKSLFIVKQNRFNPPVAELKNLIDEGRLGKILSIEINCFWNRTDEYYKQSDWKGKKLLDGGTLFTQFSHFIDLMFWLAGDVKKVYAIGKNLHHRGTVEYEDTGAAVLELSSGAIGTINWTLNSYRRNMEGSITVFGEKGTVKVGGQYLNALEYQSIEGYEIKGLPQSRPANDYGFYQGSMSNHDKVYQNVIDVLKHNGKIAASAHDGMKTVEIIEKIYSASQKS
jgi:UDP-N-acetyl-2-amino-2-deoxyglucuronate dehydrogenase